MTNDLFGFSPKPLELEDGRVVADVYETPVNVVLDLLPYIDFRPYDTLMEPCRSGGNIYNNIPIIPNHFKFWCEIREGFDYLKHPATTYPYTFIITNPPFSLGLEFLSKSLMEAETVIYLLPLNYLGGLQRVDFWEKNPPTHLLPLKRRPVFIWVCENKECDAKFQPGFAHPCPECGFRVKAQQDQINYAWYAWDRGGRLKLDNWLKVI